VLLGQYTRILYDFVPADGKLGGFALGRRDLRLVEIDEWETPCGEKSFAGLEPRLSSELECPARAGARSACR
jgi:hypothetical protein